MLQEIQQERPSGEKHTQKDRAERNTPRKTERRETHPAAIMHYAFRKCIII